MTIETIDLSALVLQPLAALDALDATGAARLLLQSPPSSSVLTLVDELLALEEWPAGNDFRAVLP